MAMDAETLGKAISSAVQTAAQAEAAKTSGVNPDNIWIAVANEIINHIQGNAEVMPGIALQAGAFSGATTAPGKIM